MVNAGVDTSFCDQPIPVTFSGQPSGGVWLGSGVTSGGVFTPNGVSVYTLRSIKVSQSSRIYRI